METIEVFLFALSGIIVSLRLFHLPELGVEGLDEFREIKHVHWDFNLEDKSYWYPYGK